MACLCVLQLLHCPSGDDTCVEGADTAAFLHAEVGKIAALDGAAAGHGIVKGCGGGEHLLQQGDGLRVGQAAAVKEKVEAGLKENGRKKVAIPTVFTTAPAVRKAFEASEYAPRLKATGVVLSSICPLMYMNNPLAGKMPVITSSNKLRTYTTARYYTDDEILVQITKGGK